MTEKISTSYLLAAKYQKPYVRLDEICREYFPHLKNEESIIKKANAQQFPFPVFRPDKSNRSPYYVHVSDLATYLDRQYQSAQDDWEKVHN